MRGRSKDLRAPCLFVLISTLVPLMVLRLMLISRRHALCRVASWLIWLLRVPGCWPLPCDGPGVYVGGICANALMALRQACARRSQDCDQRLRGESAVASSARRLGWDAAQWLVAGCDHIRRAGQRVRGGSAVAASARLHGRDAAQRLAAERHDFLIFDQRLQDWSAVTAGGWCQEFG